ncbi:MAG TPA: PDZ domain-containing protein [Gemmataceae bacterium]|jgi:S1-C subfamily serine protease/predicted esterase
MKRHVVLALLALASPAAAQPPDALNEATEQALRDAAKKVAPAVVLIETTGGTEMVGGGRRPIRKGTGPTTGLVVAADGYVISSAFNFANKPTGVFVTLPGRKERHVAKLVATDHTRMLTLLKIEATDLPVPEAAPKGDLKIGQWAVALGRALVPNPDLPPSVSVGVVSALGRIYGKAIQTDAKVSPVNYGGPLVDIDGRVLGVLVPASPRGEGDTAGVEWYDSGIGFAVPFEDVLAALPRLKEGKDLRRGRLGIGQKTADQYGVPPTVGTVAPDSPAAKAGIQSGDVILEIDGKPVAHYTALLTALGPKYEGDVVSVKLRRGKEEIKLDGLKLMGDLAAPPTAFLGVVPVRDDPELGVEVRYVFPKSPAETAGIKPGDRIMKVGPAEAKELRPFSGRDAIIALLDGLAPATEIKLELKRKDGKTETVKAKLAAMPDEVPATMPPNDTVKRALEPRKQVQVQRPTDARPRPQEKKDDDKKDEKKDEKAAKKDEKKPETGLLERTTPAKDHQYWVYVPKNYDPNVSHALVVWLHAAGHGGKDANDMVSIWQDVCEDQHVILVGPKSESETGWLASESEFVQEAARDVIKEYTIDRRRVVAHGMGVGGQMAFYLGFNARDLIRGVATSGAVLGTAPKPPEAGQRLAFFVVAGGKDPLAKEIAGVKPQLAEHKYPATFREVAEMGKEYLDRKTFDELARWIDSLDKF